MHFLQQKRFYRQALQAFFCLNLSVWTWVWNPSEVVGWLMTPTPWLGQARWVNGWLKTGIISHE